MIPHISQRTFAIIGIFVSVFLIIPIINLIPILLIAYTAPLSLIVTILFLSFASIGAIYRLVANKGSYTMTGVVNVLTAWLIFFWLLSSHSYSYKIFPIDSKYNDYTYYAGSLGVFLLSCVASLISSWYQKFPDENI